ncbi:MAG: hydroxyacid dehydrogenase [Ruminococcaceae bacterium]|nr:hydroxyacid dehydrogenase [Oscillospiraceae bacterium]
MKLLYIGDPERFHAYTDSMNFFSGLDVTTFSNGVSDEEILRTCPDADAMICDPVHTLSGELLSSMPNLRLVHSEGVAFNRFAIDVLKERKIYLCNCKGCNALPVAEQTILLILGLLRLVRSSHEAVISGNQAEVKRRHMLTGDLRELWECKVGLVGFGDIARETAKLLHAFGAQVFYYNRTRRSTEEEAAYHVSYLPLDELAASCDIISLHLAVTPDTANIVDEAFLGRMKPTAFLINTARGELVDHQALQKALIDGTIAGAGFDTLAPEPVLLDNPLLNLPAEAAQRVLFAPHIGGNTGASFRRAFTMMEDNLKAIQEDRTPNHWVNPW